VRADRNAQAFTARDFPERASPETRRAKAGGYQRVKRVLDIAKPPANIAHTRIDNRRRARPEHCAKFKVNYKWQLA